MILKIQKNRVIKFQKINSLKTDVKKIVILKSFKFLEKVNFKRYKLAVVYVLENDTTKRMQFSKSFVIKK